MMWSVRAGYSETRTVDVGVRDRVSGAMWIRTCGFELGFRVRGVSVQVEVTGLVERSYGSGVEVGVILAASGC